MTKKEAPASGNLQRKLDKRLALLCDRPGLAGNATIQKEISAIAHAYLDMLIVQGEAADCSAADALNTEHQVRINLHLAEWSRESTQHLSRFESAMQDYIAEYLVPDYVARGFPFTADMVNSQDAAESLLGSVVRAVLDVVDDKNKCTVPRGSQTDSWMARLLHEQESLLSKPVKTGVSLGGLKT